MAMVSFISSCSLTSFVSTSHSSTSACTPHSSLHLKRLRFCCHGKQWHCPSPSGGHRLSWQQALVPRASAEGVPAEILEDSKFVPIKDDDPQFGPPAMMLMGFTQDEVLKVQELLRNMEGDFLKVLICTDEMIKGTLWDAMNSSQPDFKKIKVAEGVPRICFLSGLTGEEVMMFVGAFPEAKLEPTVFAALVPKNAQKTVEELMEEIMGDHERLTQKSNQ